MEVVADEGHVVDPGWDIYVERARHIVDAVVQQPHVAELDADLSAPGLSTRDIWDRQCCCRNAECAEDPR